MTLQSCVIAIDQDLVPVRTRGPIAAAAVRQITLIELPHRE